jgi:hypothetical protein
MTDYSVRERCQGSTNNGLHCHHRGRWFDVAKLFLCRQHRTIWLAVSEAGSEMLVYWTERLPGS